MKREISPLLTLLWTIVVWAHCVAIVDAQTASSSEPNATELARMEKYLARRNDPRIIKTTIHVSDTEDVDCVDRLRQHGYDDPITIASPPTNNPIPLPDRTPVNGVMARQRYGTETDLCPKDTVPILHLTPESLKRFNSLEDFYTKNGPWVSNSTHEYATANETGNSRAIRSILSSNRPSLETTEEMSLSQIWGSATTAAGVVQTVEAGWQVWTDKWHDSYPHLFVYYTSDNYVTTGCYNTDCGKFVVYNNSTALGGALASSNAGGTVYYFETIYSQNSAGDWWVQINGTYVGYYPNTLFSAPGLKSGSMRDVYGGELAPEQGLGRHSKVDMGTGTFSAGGWGNAAFHSGIQHCLVGGSWCNWSYSNLTVSQVSKSNCYDLSFADPPTNSAFYFGGPGNPSAGCN